MVTLVLLGVTALSIGSVSHAQVFERDREVALRMLKQVKDDLRKHYYDPTFRGIDVEARFAEAEAKVRQSGSINEISQVLADLLLVFNDSHTRFYLPPRAVRVDYGWEMMIVGDAPLIVRVDPKSDAAAKGLARGDRILWLNKFEPSRQNLSWLRYYYRYVRPQSQQRVIVRKPDGTEKVYDIASRTREVSVVQFDDFFSEILLTFDFANIWDGRLRSAGPDIRVWRMPSFGDKRDVERPLKEARGAKALVLDLRGNGGGLVDTLERLASLTFDRPVVVGVETTRKGTVTTKAKPARDVFNGRIVAIVDSESASAAEMYARLLQIEKRGVVVGDRTAGAVMTARMFPHVVGIGQVAFYGTSITVGDVRMSDGSTLEHVGVVPDIPVIPTPDDLANGRDPVLARAIAEVGGQMSAEDAGEFYWRSRTNRKKR